MSFAPAIRCKPEQEFDRSLCTFCAYRERYLRLGWLCAMLSLYRAADA